MYQGKMLGFFFMALVTCNMLKTRTQEARMHARVSDSLDTSAIPEIFDYDAYGWTRPGIYPKEAEPLTWLNEKPRGIYPPAKRENFMVTEIKGRDYVEFHYSMVVGSFWWGESIPVFKDFKCSSEKCSFHLRSKAITITKSVISNPRDIQSKLKTSPPPPPPNPWRLCSSITSHIILGGDLYAYKMGSFWYKPIYWATTYIGHKITISPYKTSSMRFNITHIYPVTRNNALEGLFGFNTSFNHSTQYSKFHELIDSFGYSSVSY